MNKKRNGQRDLEIYYMKKDGKSLLEIAVKYSISKERVRQVLSSQTKKMNHPTYLRQLKEGNKSP